MNEQDLTQGLILNHLKRIAIPASVGMLFNTLYNVVDTFYAGKISTDALAGLTVSFPIFFIIVALSAGIGSGTTALASISIGKKDFKLFHALAFNSLIIGILISVLFMFIAPSLSKMLFELSGSTGASLEAGISYMKTLFLGSSFFVFSFILNALLAAQGDTKSYRNFLIFGFFLNLILDPLFIYGWFNLPKLGTMGIALATVIVQFIGVVYLTVRVLKSSLFNKNDFLASRASKNHCLDILKQGLPTSVNMSAIALGVFIINYFILHYADATSIAGFGGAVRVEQLALLPALGLNSATLTITGQNYGAKNKSRILEVQRLALKIGVAIMLIAAVIIYPLAPTLIGLFNSNPDVIKAGTTYLRIEVFAFPTYVILNILLSTLQGIKKPNFAIFIGFYRQILLPIPLFYLLGTLLNLGVKGIWWGIVLVTWSAVLFTWIYTTKKTNELKFD